MSATKPKTMIKQCKFCTVDFVIPVCRDWREHCCSSECKKKLREQVALQAKEARYRECLRCGKGFYPRKYQIDSGDGKFCSIKCSAKNAIAIAHTPEPNAKRAASYIRTMNGKFRRGADHPQWKGGPQEARKRRIMSGKAAAYTRQFRAKNPEMVREWSNSRRANKNSERIEYGFYKKLLSLQKGKCAICRRGIPKGYHVDHVYPLSRGGRHHKDNIQLLCESCNVRKSAKDPIEFMQSRGFLL